jgi:hypothetical protein
VKANKRTLATRNVTLLGPQHRTQTVAKAVADLGVTGQVATITAGWEERESEDAELSEHLGGRTHNLGLYPRAEQVFVEDTAVRSMLNERHDRLRELQALYRLRLTPQLRVCRELFARTDPAEPDALHGPEIDGAIAGVRAVDQHHLARTAALDAEIFERMKAHERPSIERNREELADVLETVEALLISGGHVGTLLNRLRLFDVLGLAPSQPVVAWSGGAMVMAERLVLFHDSPPQGPGNPEVYAPGLGLVKGILPLPHASNRLRLDDPGRVALFARRFAPDICATLDDGARLDNAGGIATWRLSGGARVLQSDGRVQEPRSSRRRASGHSADVSDRVSGAVT